MSGGGIRREVQDRLKGALRFRRFALEQVHLTLLQQGVGVFRILLQDCRQETFSLGKLAQRKIHGDHSRARAPVLWIGFGQRFEFLQGLFPFAGSIQKNRVLRLVFLARKCRHLPQRLLRLVQAFAGDLVGWPADTARQEQLPHPAIWLRSPPPSSALLRLRSDRSGSASASPVGSRSAGSLETFAVLLPGACWRHRSCPDATPPMPEYQWLRYCLATPSKWTPAGQPHHAARPGSGWSS